MQSQCRMRPVNSLRHEVCVMHDAQHTGVDATSARIAAHRVSTTHSINPTVASARFDHNSDGRSFRWRLT